jgi:Flp pilus assembly protein TadD
MRYKSVKISSIIFFAAHLIFLAHCGPQDPSAAKSAAPSPAAVKARWYNNQGVVYMDQHNYVKGRDHFLQATQLDSSYANGFANLGISFYSLGEFEQAQNALEQALVLDQAHLHARYTLGLIFQGQAYDRARDAFEKVRETDPDEPLVHYYLGQVYGKLGQGSEAIASLKETIRLDPSNVSAHYSLAQQFRKQGDMDRFKSYLEKFTRLQQAGYQSVSQSYQGQGKYAEAEADAGYSDPNRDDRGGDFVFSAQALDASTDSPYPWSTAADWDNDGDMDLIVGTPTPSWRRNDNGSFAPPQPLAGVEGTNWQAGLAGDFDNDGQQDLVLCGPEESRIWLKRGESLEPMATFAASTSPTAGDVDHDGDLDLILLGAQGLALWSNLGEGNFEDLTAKAGLLLDTPGRRAVISDFDNDRDVDLFVLSDAGLFLFTNKRDGTFAEIAADAGLQRPQGEALAVEDLNQDGYMDLCLASDGNLSFWLNRGNGSFGPGGDAALNAAASGISGSDLDNDGDLDLIAYGEGGIYTLAWRHGAFEAPQAVVKEAAEQLLAVDWDGDGDADLYDGGRLWLNDTQGGGWIKISLEGLNSNLDGIGTKVEVKTTFRLQKREWRGDGTDLTFGLGQTDSVEFVRLLWPGGVRQTELATAASQTLHLTELDRKGTSCPILYAWDGEKYRFVTDILGGGIIGYLTAPGEYGSTDTDEYISLGPIAPRQGRYILQIANQLEEIIYLDGAELVAVDHPAGLEIYPNERLLSAPPYPESRFYPVSGLRPPAGAIDDTGKDILDLLSQRDDIWHDDFAHLDIHGYATEHSIVLDLGDLDGVDHPVLLAYGWVDYAHSTSNWAAGQRGLALTPNRLEVGDGNGGWRLAQADMGSPAGLPKHMLVDLQGLLTPGDHRLRISTNATVYWDQFLVGQAHDAPLSVHRRQPAAADLHWRGYPAHTSIKGTFAFRYDYDQLQTDAPWGTHGGAFTKFGDVTPLLGTPDDRYVIMFHGDEITVEFDADSLPPLPEGQQRTFLLYASGFGKDMDFHSAHSLTVEPLPYHGMPSYPYPNDAPYPQTAEHMDYRLEYNTRHIKGYYR